MAKLKNAYPLAFTLILYWVLTIGLLVQGAAQTEGHFIYPLDDTYIHMAIGKHFVQDGAWSVTTGVDFTSTTSSPLWTLLVAGSYALLGVNEWSPLVLDLIFGSATLVLMYSLLKRRIKRLPLTVYLLLTMLFTCLPTLTLTGMEHTLHCLLSLWLLYRAADYLSAEQGSQAPAKKLIPLLIVSALLPITRYEGIFLVGIFCFLLLLAKRILPAVLIGAAALLPVSVYGLISLSQGWDFIPSSVLLKGNTPSLSAEGILQFVFRLPNNLTQTVHILLLLVACLVMALWLVERGIAARREKYLLLIYVLITLLHMQFAGTGWFFRYEAYLILAGCMVLLSAVAQVGSSSLRNPAGQATAAASGLRFLLAFGLGILLFIPLLLRTGKALQDYPDASMNIYHQHYQMGLFLQTYYSGKPVIANDIGAINFLADIRVLDVYGLGSIEVAHAKQAGQWNKARIEALTQAQHADVAIIYDIVLGEDIPSAWVAVGRWQIFDNVVVGSEFITFYAPTAAQADELIAHLKDFSPRLPQGIEQSGEYTK